MTAVDYMTLWILATSIMGVSAIFAAIALLMIVEGE